MIGAYAVMIHAQPRATKDLDILIGSDPKNAALVFRALAKFGAPLQGMKPEDLTAIMPRSSSSSRRTGPPRASRSVNTYTRDNLPNPIQLPSNPYVPPNMPAIDDLMSYFNFSQPAS